MAEKISSPVEASPPVVNFSLRSKYIILTAIGLVFYGNTLFNKYAFDDNMVIVKNAYVQMGFSGIPTILTHDSYYSYYSNVGGGLSANLSGGRFRPLSEIIFAIEQQLFRGSEILPYFRHFVNILAYIACVIAIFYFLENFLLKKIPWGSDIAFISAFLFAIHPLHTEVVANVKSLDEILSLFFIMLTFICGLQYLQNKKTKHLVFGMGSFFFALLSKEYAVTLLFFIPFLFYLLEDRKLLSAARIAIPYYIVVVVYFALRYSAVGFHIGLLEHNLINNPYLYTTHVQKIATEWFVLGKYLGLLFFPYPLSCDYSYCQIPYHGFLDIAVLLSILGYIAVLIWGIVLLRKKNVLSFAIFFFLFNVLMISNFIVDIGATMGERLMFHASLGFSIVLSYYLFKAISRVSAQIKRRILIITMSIVGISCFGETVIRNMQWADDVSLFIHDVKVAPNSCLVNRCAGWEYLQVAQEKQNSPSIANSCLDSASKYLLQAVHLYPKYDIAYFDLVVTYIHKQQPDSAIYCWDMVKKINPKYPLLDSNYQLLTKAYLLKGVDLADNGRFHEGISYIKKAILLDSTNADLWYNMGVAYFGVQQYDSAKYALMKTLQNKPNSTDSVSAQRGLQALSKMKQQ